MMVTEAEKPVEGKQDYQALQAEIDSFKSQLTEAAGAGDVDKVITLSASLTKTKNKVKKYEAGHREEKAETARADLADRFSKIRISATDTYEVSRFNGKTTVTVVESATVREITKAVEAVSLEGINFKATLSKDAPTVEMSVRKAGSGTGPSGWTKDGGTTIEKLGAVFAEHATEEEKAKAKGLDGNKAYTVKKNVAKRAGYEQAGS